MIPLLIELVRGGGQLVVVGGLLRGWSACPMPTPPCASQESFSRPPPYSRHSVFVYGAGAVKIKGAPPESSGSIDAGFHQKKAVSF